MTYVRGWNPENCPIIPLFLILCNNFMAIFAKLYFSFSEAPINRMEKLSVVQNATKSMSCFFFFFTTLMTILFLEKKKNKNKTTNICLMLFSVPSLPTALVSEFSSSVSNSSLLNVRNNIKGFSSIFLLFWMLT